MLTTGATLKVTKNSGNLCKSRCQKKKNGVEKITAAPRFYVSGSAWHHCPPELHYLIPPTPGPRGGSGGGQKSLEWQLICLISNWRGGRQATTHSTLVKH